ncbi:MAG: CDP-glycerol glycerophosphotransferase family protein [Candidatus Muiribacteriota bacterium]
MIGLVASKYIVSGLNTFFKFVLGWGFFFPLGLIFKRKKNRWIFIGRDDGRFLDNVKYFYLYVSENKKEIDYYFLTQNFEHYVYLKKNNIRVIFHPTLKSFYKLLTCDKVIVDSDQWTDIFKYQILWKVFKVQLWHGSGLKRIELDNPKSRPFRKWRKITGRFADYNLITASSEFFAKNYFKKAFNYWKMEVTGFPRNDIFFNMRDKNLINVDLKTYLKCQKLKKEGKRIVLWAPTFRDTGGDPLSDGAVSFNRLSEFADKNNLIFVFKFHPHPKFKYLSYNSNNIFFYDNSKDVYPFMRLCDLLITDYSSIYIDYLLSHKPVLFFCYDFEKYTGKDRDIKFDYNFFGCGPKVKSKIEFEFEVLNILKKEKYYLKEREKVKKVAFKFYDGNASKRIFSFLMR